MTGHPAVHLILLACFVFSGVPGFAADPVGIDEREDRLRESGQEAGVQPTTGRQGPQLESGEPPFHHCPGRTTTQTNCRSDFVQRTCCSISTKNN